MLNNVNKGLYLMELITAPPKSQQVAKVIREQIKGNKIKPGQRLESVRSLAEKFSVGRQVVLSAFDILASEGLIYSHVGRGTFVSGTTGGVVASKNYRIGFFINQSRVETFYNRNVFLGASEKASEAGITMLLAPNDDGFELKLWAKRKELDGLLVSGRVGKPLVKMLKQLNIPFVLIGNYDVPADINVIEAYTGNVIHETMNCLWSKFKYKSAGAILGPADLKASQELAQAIKVSLKELPVECKPENIVYSEMENGYEEANKIFSNDNAPEVLFVTGEAFPGLARYFFEKSNDKNFKRPIIITAIADKYNIMYPELIDVAIYYSAREMGNVGIEKMIQLLDGKISQIKFQVQTSGFELPGIN
jgi:DNA-binding LacI/PurR family transcriptional regulator